MCGGWIKLLDYGDVFVTVSHRLEETVRDVEYG